MDEPNRIDEFAATLSRLERDIALLKLELNRLRQPTASEAQAEQAPRPATTPDENRAPSIPLTIPTPSTSGPSGDRLEYLMGRYGALVLAVFTILMGAGALVSWAIARGLLTPVVRVALGALLVAALAGTGWILRRRGQWAFGRLLVALAFAVLQVVVWGAGSQLALIPERAALALADLAAVALAALAMHDNDEEMLIVGIAGALIAPFVQVTGEGALMALAVYGLIISSAALRVCAERHWRRAITAVIVGALPYTLALLGLRDVPDALMRQASPGFAVVLALFAALMLDGALRAGAVLSYLAIAAVFASMRWPSAGEPAAAATSLVVSYADVLATALVVTGFSLWNSRRLVGLQRLWWLIGALVVPFLMLVLGMRALLPSLPGMSAGFVRGAVDAVWVAAFALAAFSETGPWRGALLTAGGVIATAAVNTALAPWPWAVAPALAALTVLLAATARREGSPLPLIAALFAVVVGYASASSLMAPPFGVPFVSLATLGYLTIVAALAGSSVLVRAVPAELLRPHVSPATAARALAATAAFGWWHHELGRAFNPDIATFLLVFLYATVGVLVLWRGRVVESSGLRRLGLALCAWGALFAVAQAMNVQHIGLRVGSYLAAGAFLLGVAGWYRSRT